MKEEYDEYQIGWKDILDFILLKLRAKDEIKWVFNIDNETQITIFTNNEDGVEANV